MNRLGALTAATIAAAFVPGCSCAMDHEPPTDASRPPDGAPFDTTVSDGEAADADASSASDAAGGRDAWALDTGTSVNSALSVPFVPTAPTAASTGHFSDCQRAAERAMPGWDVGSWAVESASDHTAFVCIGADICNSVVDAGSPTCLDGGVADATTCFYPVDCRCGEGPPCADGYQCVRSFADPTASRWCVQDGTLP